MGGLKRFILYLGGFTLLAYAITFFFIWLSPENLVSEVLLFIPAFYFVVMLGSKLILHAATRKHERKFSQVFLAISVFRFLLYLAVLLAYSFVNKADAVRFIISFFTFYFFYTVTEVSFLYRDLHPRKS